MKILAFRQAAAFVLEKPKDQITKAEIKRMKRAWAYLTVCQKCNECYENYKNARVDKRSRNKHHPQEMTSFARSNRTMGTNL